MNARFKELRRELKLTQEEFANKMNLSRSYINLIEMGKKVPADRTIKDICREFGVNEEWLREGTGEMFIQKSKDEEISELLADIQKSGDESFKHRLVSALAKLDEDGWNKLEELIDIFSSK